MQSVAKLQGIKIYKRKIKIRITRNKYHLLSHTLIEVNLS